MHGAVVSEWMRMVRCLESDCVACVARMHAACTDGITLEVPCCGVLRCDARVGAVVPWLVHAHAQCSHWHGGAAENQVRMMAEGVLPVITGALKAHSGAPGVVEYGLWTLANLAMNGA